jgi:hypothetical protein
LKGSAAPPRSTPVTTIGQIGNSSQAVMAIAIAPKLPDLSTGGAITHQHK